MTAAHQPSLSTRKDPRRDPFARALEWHAAQPRAVRWAVAAGVAFAAFLLLDNLLWPAADRLNERADRMTQVLDRAAGRAEELPSDVRSFALVHGPNAAPKVEVQGKEKLAAAVDAVLKKNGVADYSFDDRAAQPLAGSALADVAAFLGGKMGRTVAEIRFDGSPDAVSSILHDLDASPDVDCITDLRLTYAAATKRVTVQMTLEKWGVIRNDSNRRGGA